MIVSQTHRYLFIENPLTGSWAIHRELCDYYDGQPILHKHATYDEFKQEVGSEAADYFVFATVRHPLDKIVSSYVKLKTNHKGAFSGEKSIDKLYADYVDLRKFRFVQEEDATFADYFKAFHRQPYGDMLDLSAGHLDFVIRFEHLQEDFAALLERLDIEQVRPVPVRNKTPGKERDWRSYYTPDIVEQAKRVAGPYMAKWQYEFPPEWGNHQLSPLQNSLYRLHLALRRVYNSQFRYNNRSYARMVRSLRARLLG